jgi:NAD(P)-dependent dehydrogenase (short-subunit alcohol dehydrogenase family)
MNGFNHPFSLTGKHIVITGASSGIGRQCAIACSQLGANVTLVARSKERLMETSEHLLPGNHRHYALDITEYDRVEPLISEIIQTSGKISGFIHSAGIESTLPFKATKPNTLKKIFETNVVAGFEWARILTDKKFAAVEGGSIIFIASVMGLVGKPGLIAYSSSKGALIAGCKSMALELAAKNIRVNCISPGMVKTEMMNAVFDSLSEQAVDNIIKAHPLGLGQPTDVAWACTYLLSDAARWITGSNLVIDGGYSIM